MSASSTGTGDPRVEPITEHKSLAEALSAFQGEAPKLYKGAEANAGSFHYRYVDLAHIVETIQPLMRKHGLSFSAFPCIGSDGKPALRYKLTHVSGDCESDVMSLMVSKVDAQAHGSAISYARRYALTSVLNLVADADDDGAAARAAQERAQAQANGQSTQPTAGPVRPTERPASAAQRGKLNAKAAEAQLCPSDYANVILIASGQDVRDFESEEAAERWLKRALDRFPAVYVDAALKQMERIKAGAGVAA